MHPFVIGIDTGGTCTDAALIDSRNGAVVATAKVPTTHYRLSDGISAALRALLEKSSVAVDRIRVVSLSTTLATNSVVEKKGARVGLFVIGYVKHFKLPVTAVIYLKGGHTIHGDEEEPLELEYLVETVDRLKPEVDAYAVCASMSMTNATHELVAEKAIAMIDPKPVFCSHRASGQSGMHKRAATAALHAKLMPVMHDFTAGVDEAMSVLQLACPLRIMTGSGGAITPEEAVHRAGATVASGPACTALFGAHHSTVTGLVVDVGGTTTDIAMIENGSPVLAAEGCCIDSWVTHIPSVDMHTGGIGGDSLVVLNRDGVLSLGPTRVTPLSLSPETPPPSAWLGPGTAARCIHPEPSAGRCGAATDPVLACLLENGPLTTAALQQMTRLSGIPLDRHLERLNRERLIRDTGFTPTDALHVLGRTAIGDPAVAAAAAEVLARAAGMGVEPFCRRVVEQTEEQIARLIVGYVAGRLWGSGAASILASRVEHSIVTINIRLNIPLIGIGAAARFFLPAVAEKLGTTVSFPRFHEVGNAIAAAWAAMDRPPSSRENDR